MKDYLQQAAVTAPKQILGKLPASIALNCLRSIIQEGNYLDKIKKHMFYGKDLPGHIGGSQDRIPCCDMPIFLSGVGTEEDRVPAVEIIHGVIGAITETVELAEALVHALDKNEPIDVVNLAEECGDVLWYLACILRHSGKDFPALMEQNIAKLRKRYPDGFTTYDALNRDLAEERQVLEHRPIPEGYAPASKPVVNLRNAVLLPGNDENGPVLRLAGEAEAHPQHGDNPVRTSRIVKFDATTSTYETRNTVYKVISWAM